ncbi:putative ABC transport system ATP-binding protein [Halopseudomonas xinjiangensis]|uniref:Putative ABC transport system ATP-binding protein n=1 Tax=Halopseudomonas xinjiangensis TaxID=487184 RepID=A0A1H1WNS2_9GAMM|nr:ABC transporter ATP-binding protein [Halopseudomonas xinjiangensis]SDS98300.1 putative ABC transport system ATP-binding protein [Halopseudomonas xinjiangensis]
MAAEIIRIESLRYAWPGQPLLLAIDEFLLARGERLFLKGPSGSGKTTLLGLIGGVNRPDAGTVRLLGEDLYTLSSSRRDRFRSDHIGYIFQMFNLLPYLSVIDNVTLACSFSPVRRERALADHQSLTAAARSLLIGLGLQDSYLQRPVSELSVGQQQRVAAARALIGKPELIIADEPTSALDADTRQTFISLLFDECARAGTSLLFVSHDASLETLFDRSLSLGQLNLAQRQENA